MDSSVLYPRSFLKNRSSVSAVNSGGTHAHTHTHTLCNTASSFLSVNKKVMLQLKKPDKTCCQHIFAARQISALRRPSETETNRSTKNSNDSKSGVKSSSLFAELWMPLIHHIQEPLRNDHPNQRLNPTASLSSTSLFSNSLILHTKPHVSKCWCNPLHLYSIYTSAVWPMAMNKGIRRELNSDSMPVFLTIECMIKQQRSVQLAHNNNTRWGQKNVIMISENK